MWCLHLLPRIQTYRKVAPMATHGRDIYQTIQRYYRNAFTGTHTHKSTTLKNLRMCVRISLSLSTDADKQAAINVFLGVFRPEVGQPNIWELQTDYYMHHSSTRLSVPTKTFQRYIILQLYSMLYVT